MTFKRDIDDFHVQSIIEGRANQIRLYRTITKNRKERETIYYTKG